MGLVIGMDEAGYGPNLGPLVVTATVWEVPGTARAFDFWSEMAEVVSQSPPAGNSHLHVADSKQVYNPAKGLAPLERAVLCALHLGGLAPRSFQELCRLTDGRRAGSSNGLSAPAEPGFPVPQTERPPSAVDSIPLAKTADSTDAAADGAESPLAGEPWFESADLPLPHAVESHLCDEIGRRWSCCCEEREIRLRAVRCDVVLTRRFNRLMQSARSKGAALSRISMNLLRQVWDPDDSEPALIVADKHGGRNRYHGFLAEVLDGQMILQQQESRACSRYRVGQAEIRFQMQAESHFPVAVASMVSKYVRELSMELFNRFWAAHVPDLKPTKGYPLDARRFRSQVAGIQEQLGIADEDFWRER